MTSPSTSTLATARRNPATSCLKTYTDTATGTKADRPEWDDDQ